MMPHNLTCLTFSTSTSFRGPRRPHRRLRSLPDRWGMIRVSQRVLRRELPTWPTIPVGRRLRLQNLHVARTDLFQDRSSAFDRGACEAVHLSTVHIIEDDRRARFASGRSEDKIIEPQVLDVANV